MRLEAVAGVAHKVVLIRKGGSTRLWVLPRNADSRGDPTRVWMRELDDAECAEVVRLEVARFALPTPKRKPVIVMPQIRHPCVPRWLLGVRERLDADATARATLDARIAAALSAVSRKP